MIQKRQIETQEVVTNVPGSVLVLLFGQVQSEPEVYQQKKGSAKNEHEI